jgi:hypothetical protein
MKKIDTSTKTKGLICQIYRAGSGEHSNGGISSHCQAVTLVDIGVDVFEPTGERPAVKLVKRNNFVHAEPVQQPTGLVGPMAGGTFIYSSDSRFPSQYPIALHDRWETQEQYDSLSR